MSIETWFWIAGAFLVLVTARAWLFVRSDAGRVLVAIRENEQRCEYLGINVSRVKILLMVAHGGHRRGRWLRSSPACRWWWRRSTPASCSAPSW